MSETSLEGVIGNQREGQFSIVSARETDSFGSPKWREYLDSHRLTQAWQTPEGSPYARFQKTKTTVSVDQWGSKVKPRYSEGEQTSEEGIENLIKSGLLGRETAVILDSGGAHSVAMAVRLAERLGYQPVIMFDSTPHPKGANKSEQELATMLYFAEQISKLKREGKIRPDAPPVFVLDTHRDDYIGHETGVVKNTYTYREQDLPTAEDFQKLGIRRIVYLNEGDQDGEIHQSYQSLDRVAGDLKPSVRKWTKAGISVSYTGISPWGRDEEDAFEGFGASLRRLEGFDFESRLSYPDMPPGVYGDGDGIGMHQNRERFIVTNEGETMVINEKGISRDMKPEELDHFRAEIEKQLSLQPKNKELRKLYEQLPK